MKRHLKSRLTRHLKKADTFKTDNQIYYKLTASKRILVNGKLQKLKNLLWLVFFEEQPPVNSVIVATLPDGSLSTEYWISDIKLMQALTLSEWRTHPDNPINK